MQYKYGVILSARSLRANDLARRVLPVLSDVRKAPPQPRCSLCSSAPSVVNLRLS
jgi:hypothetical protein